MEQLELFPRLENDTDNENIRPVLHLCKICGYSYCAICNPNGCTCFLKRENNND